jgi:hypothetical protein
VKKAIKLSLLAFASLSILEVRSANALTISNGGFETPLVTDIPSTKFLNPPTTSNLFWTGSNGSVEIFSETFNGLSAYQGNQWGEVQNTGLLDSLTNTVTGITTNKTLNFSFAHAARPGTGSNTLNFKIVETLTPSTILFSQNYTALDDLAWDLIQGTFITQVTSVDFIFTGVSTGLCPDPTCGQPGNGNFIDSVHVTDPHPVPGPLPLMGAATAFAYTRKIRRRIGKAKS